MDTFNHTPRGTKKKQRTRSVATKILAGIFLLVATSTPSSNLIAILPARDDFTHHNPDTVETALHEDPGYQQEADVVITSAGSNRVRGFNVYEYEKQLQNATEVDPDIETACYLYEFYSGLNNQLMRFLGILSLAATEGYRQYLEPSILWKDTYGTSQKISHHKLWDVVHWNTFYPDIPRLVKYDPRYHPHVADVGKVVELGEGVRITVPEMTYKVSWDVWANRSMTKPAPSGQNRHQSLNQFNQMMRYHDKGSKDPGKIKQFSFYKPMIAGALKPHPFLQLLVDKEKASLAAGGKYMAFHARVEPDMARQDRVCWVRVHSLCL